MGPTMVAEPFAPPSSKPLEDHQHKPNQFIYYKTFQKSKLYANEIPHFSIVKATIQDYKNYNKGACKS